MGCAFSLFSKSVCETIKKTIPRFLDFISIRQETPFSTATGKTVGDYLQGYLEKSTSSQHEALYWVMGKSGSLLQACELSRCLKHVVEH